METALRPKRRRPAPREVIVLMRLNLHPDNPMALGIMRYADEHATDWQVKLVDPTKVTPADLANGDAIVFRGAMPPLVRALGKRVRLAAIDMPPDEAAEKMENLVRIRFNNESIGKMAAEHFLSRSASRSFAYVPCETGRHWSDPRQRGFVRAIRAKGGDAHVYEPTRDGSLTDFIIGLPLPTAILASCDYEAPRILSAIEAAELTIPEEAMLLGVDNESSLPIIMRPTLSSIGASHEAEGYQAAEALDRMFSGRRLPKDRVLYVEPTGVTERESTARLPKAERIVATALAYIEQRATCGIGSDAVARKMGVSRRLADKRFREVSGMSILDAIHRRQIAIAKRLLNKSVSIDDIVTRCGFGTRRSFELRFKAHTGRTPAVWRNAANAKRGQTPNAAKPGE